MMAFFMRSYFGSRLARFASAEALVGLTLALAINPPGGRPALVADPWWIIITWSGILIIFQALILITVEASKWIPED